MQFTYRPIHHCCCLSSDPPPSSDTPSSFGGGGGGGGAAAATAAATAAAPSDGMTATGPFYAPSGAPLQQVPSTPARAASVSSHRSLHLGETPVLNNHRQGTGTPMREQSTNLAAVRKSLATPRGADTVLSSFSELSVGEDSTVSSIGEIVSGGKDSATLCSEAKRSLDGATHLMLTNLHEFMRDSATLEKDPRAMDKFMVKLERSKTHSGLQNFEASTDAEVKSYTDAEDEIELQLEQCERVKENLPTAASIEKENIEKENENEKIAIASKYKELFRQAKERAEAEWQQLVEGEKSEMQASDSKANVKKKELGINEKGDTAQARADMAFLEKRLEKTRKEKVKKLTLAKAFLLAIRKGFKLCDFLVEYHEISVQAEEVKAHKQQEYLAMKTEHLILLELIAKEDVKALKDIVWQQEQVDD